MRSSGWFLYCLQTTPNIDSVKKFPRLNSLGVVLKPSSGIIITFGTVPSTRQLLPNTVVVILYKSCCCFILIFVFFNCFIFLIISLYSISFIRSFAFVFYLSSVIYFFSINFSDFLTHHLLLSHSKGKTFWIVQTLYLFKNIHIYHLQ